MSTTFVSTPVVAAHPEAAPRLVACAAAPLVSAFGGDGNVIVPVLGGMPHHLTSHENGANFAEVQRWYATKVARLFGQLDVADPLGGLHGARRLLGARGR